ncbi:hypothetical protein ACKWTF_008369 [Chironomus riparius]
MNSFKGLLSDFVFVSIVCIIIFWNFQSARLCFRKGYKPIKKIKKSKIFSNKNLLELYAYFRWSFDIHIIADELYAINKSNIKTIDIKKYWTLNNNSVNFKIFQSAKIIIIKKVT